MKKWAWPVLGLFVASCFWGFWSYGPFDLDEGLYSVALMEMQKRGDWVVPTYRGVPFFEKPIFFYWTAWITDICGAAGVVALRLPSVLATLATLGLVGHFAKRTGPVMILAVSILFMGVGRMFMPDPFLVFGMTLALLALWKSRDDPRWNVAAAAGLAISVLAKGPMPLVVLGLLGIYCHWRMDPWPRPLNTFRWRFASLILFLIAVLPWYITAPVRSDVFVQDFLIKQNLGRLAGGDVAHAGPVWMYIPVVLIGLLPFSFSLPSAFRRREGGMEQYLWAYVLIVFVIFSLAGTKLPHYILPIFPPLAILLSRFLERDSRIWWEFTLPVLMAPSVYLYFLLTGSSQLAPLRPAIFASFLLLGLLAVAVRLFGWPRSLSLGFVSVAPLTLAILLFGPQMYWDRTHADPTHAAIVASRLGLPIIEYRTGGEGVRGETAHPSMQWTVGRNTVAVDNLRDLERAVAIVKGVVITRDERLQNDVRQVAPNSLHLMPVESSGVWDVFVVSRIDTPPKAP